MSAKNYAMELATMVHKYLQENHKAYVDNCGEDDDVCARPAKEALDNMESLIEAIKRL